MDSSCLHPTFATPVGEAGCVDVSGSDLAAVIAHAPLSIAVAAEYVLQACVALAEAHVLGSVHRDLKPSNLFLTRRLNRTALVKVMKRDDYARRLLGRTTPAPTSCKFF